MIVNVIVTQHHRRPSTQISHKPVVLRYMVDGFGSFWLVLLVVVGGFEWFWLVLAGFALFHFLVTTFPIHIMKPLRAINIMFVMKNSVL